MLKCDTIYLGRTEIIASQGKEYHILNRTIGLCILLIIFKLPMEFNKEYDVFLKCNRHLYLQTEAESEAKTEAETETETEAEPEVQFEVEPGITETMTPMEALDLVQKKYAANFLRINITDGEEYYYKLPHGAYYLVYEGVGETDQEFIIHLYEFVSDEPETETGHFVTYGWYKVNGFDGNIDVIEYWN